MRASTAGWWSWTRRSLRAAAALGLVGASIVVCRAEAPARPAGPTVRLVQPVSLAHQPEQRASAQPTQPLTVDTQPSAGPLPADEARQALASTSPPEEHAGNGRPWGVMAAYWAPTNYCHRPLYFEQPALERNGYGYGCLQTAVSGAHFFATIPILPYKMAVDRPRECVYTLGQPRPGTAMPPYRYRIPVQLDAATIQATVVTGAAFALP